MSVDPSTSGMEGNLKKPDVYCGHNDETEGTNGGSQPSCENRMHRAQ